MAHNRDQTEPLADVYAEALLAAASERGEEEAVFREFGELVQLIEREMEFCAVLVSDSVDDEPRRASLERILRGRIHDLILNLLQVMNSRGRIRLVRQVYRCVELRMEARHHQQEVWVETPMPLSEDLKAAICGEMGARLGKEVILIEEVRPELIGGVVIHYGDMQVDGSVASQIRRTYKRLCERATEEIHGGRGYAVEA